MGSCCCCKSKQGYEAKSGEAVTPVPEKSLKSKIAAELKEIGANIVNVNTVHRECQGTLRIRNDYQRDVYLQFIQTKLSGKPICYATVKAGSDFVFDPGVNDQFDFLLVLERDAVTAHVMRGGSYKIVDLGGKLSIEAEFIHNPISCFQLASVKGLSISMSASGWLLVYQLGAAECLQKHGIAKNPYVRVSGASGGALAVALMMYDADMRAVRDILIECAKRVHGKWARNIGLRRFLFEAMSSVIRDGSYQHPAFQSGRVEIGVSATTSSLPGFFAKILLTGSEKRCKEFKNSADVAIALLASSTIGLSGLPFSMKDESGKEMVVADGAVKNFLPTIDEHSITVKPLCDGLHFTATGQLADVRPTEYVPSSFGLFPPSVTMMHHLYELGYQDMQQWIQDNLDERLEALQQHAEHNTPDLPAVTFECKNHGMLWREDVLEKVPMSWMDMLKHSFYADDRMIVKPLHEGMLTFERLCQCEVDESGHLVTTESMTISYPFRVKLTKVDISWCPESEKEAATSTEIPEEQMEGIMRGLMGTGFFSSSKEAVLDRAKTGRIHLTWLRDVVIDSKAHDMLHVRTSQFLVSLKASTPESAQTWREAIQAAVDNVSRSMRDAEFE